MEKVGLEISVSEDFTSACIQPEVYDQLVELGIDVGAPILVPSGLELFEDIDAYVGVSYCAVGNDPTQIPALDTAQLVSGFIGDQNHRDCRYLVVAEILELHPIDNTDDFVLASVMLDKWSEAFVVLSSEISPHVHERSIIWCACDKVDSMAEFSQLNRSSPNKLHALFRVGLNLASQYTPVTLWQLMVDHGESWSSMVALLATMEAEGYRLRRSSGAAELYFLEQVLSAHVPVRPSAESDAACEALLTAVDSLLAKDDLYEDSKTAAAANLLAQQVLIKAPTRVLAKYAGREVLEVAMASAEAWVEEAYSLSDSGQISEHKINVYDPNVWAFFHQTRALVRAILCNGTGSTYSSIFTVGSLVGESVELECVVSSELMLVHPRDLRNISVVGYTH